MASDDSEPGSVPEAPPPPPPPPVAQEHVVETEWIRAYARTYIVSETPFSYCPQKLREIGVTLVDIRNICRRGRVVYANKLDGPGALWIVEGADMDERKIRWVIVVVSEEISVSLRSVELINGGR